MFKPKLFVYLRVILIKEKKQIFSKDELDKIALAWPSLLEKEILETISKIRKTTITRK